MRIIGGKYKGKKLLLPINKNTRPLKDMVKESIFNLLIHSNKIKIDIADSNVLDLFSGSGSFGIECISRGAKNVYFFENYSEAIKILNKNLSLLKLNHNYKVFEKNCFDFFKENKLKNIFFDIVFIDPPYNELKLNSFLDLIFKNDIISKKTLFIIHRHKKDTIAISEKIQLVEVRNYGISKISLGYPII